MQNECFQVKDARNKDEMWAYSIRSKTTKNLIEYQEKEGIYLKIEIFMH